MSFNQKEKRRIGYVNAKVHIYNDRKTWNWIILTMSTDTSFSILHCHTQRKPFFPTKKKKKKGNSFKKNEKRSHILLK